ncbi:13291_t:CDS:1 [Acaulospora colombiana]|uniref:13291_t:CDS:1 n=1 Tax=Acaulospora colombiana TaxID=27376 RepID=A0ACA9JVY4_9GLOM|nr:13291_t:CDS:1 [Acaulospora colombiana]
MTGATGKISQKILPASLQVPSVTLRGTAEKYISAQQRAYLEKKYEPSDFKPTFKRVDMWGRARWKAPKISRRRLNDMRKNCEYLNIDPQEIGLLAKPERKLLRAKPNKGKKHERNAPERYLRRLCRIDIA